MIKSVPASLLSLIFLTALSFTGMAYACETLMIGTRELARFANLRAKPTVEYVGEIPGLHDGNLSILEMIGGNLGGSWLSTYTVSRRAPQGDARQAVSLLGPLVANFIGIRAVKDQEFLMTIPDIDEVIGALKKLNRALIKLGYEPVPISFYLQTKELGQPYMFVKLFSQSMQLPFSMQPRLRIHDVAFHLGSIAFPVEVLMPIVERYRLAFDFFNYTLLTSFPDRKNLRQLSKMMKNMERDVDLSLGSIQAAYAKLAQLNPLITFNRSKVDKERYTEFHNNLTNEWKRFTFVEGSSKDFIESHLLRVMSNQDANSILLSDTFLGKRLEEFLKLEQNRHVDWNKSLKNLTSNELHEKILNRHAELMQAVYLVQRGGI